MQDDIDEFLDGADIRGTEHRSDARRVLEVMLDAAHAAGKVEGAREVMAKVMAFVDEVAGSTVRPLADSDHECPDCGRHPHRALRPGVAECGEERPRTPD